jgi:1-acyl-sn-glycerol-3-phosphate acyltransferase
VEVALEGAERADWKQPSVVVANHQSWFDVFVLVAALPGRVRFVAKKELGRIPIFGHAWRACGHISIDREDRKSAIESLDRAAERVRAESLTMTLFPEGTRSPDGRLQDFKKGAFVLAMKTGLPIVPVGIIGTRDVMPKGSFRVSTGRVRIRVGHPILPTRVQDGRDELRAKSRAAVALLIDGENRRGPNLSHEHSRETSE